LTSNSEPPNSKLKTQNSKLNAPNFLPLWNSDLYLEFHRGCYTTHADQKLLNRRSEELLYQAELWASLATISTGVVYPKTELEAAWKKVLFNQFHDILPGSSITEVFNDANEEWEKVETTGQKVLREAFNEIAQQIALPPPPHPAAKAIVVFNSLNWERSDHVVVLPPCQPVESEETSDENIKKIRWQLLDLQGQAVKFPYCAQMQHNTGLNYASFIAENIPAHGYRCFWLCPCDPKLPVDQAETTSFVLENEFLQVTVDPATGDLSSVFDKVQQREVLNGHGNQLQSFRDAGQYWDAWNIDPEYAEHPLPPTELRFIEYPRQDSMAPCIRVKRKLGMSDFVHDYILEPGSPMLKIHTSVTWEDSHTLVKAVFPLNIEVDYATYEIPCGMIQRTTKPESDREKAQWEVPAMHWADLSDGHYGVSLLNNCKYGYDAQPSQLRITLLRGSEWPDPEADKGHHSFTYAIYPHGGDWKTAQTVQKGYELNLPLQAMVISPNRASSTNPLPPTASLLNLKAENLVLMSFKQSEDNPNEYILRCYECHGEPAELNLQSELNLSLQHPVDLLERPTDSPKVEGQTVTVHPWKIASFKVSVN
jgi:alpha-mannosidase